MEVGQKVKLSSADNKLPYFSNIKDKILEVTAVGDFMALVKPIDESSGIQPVMKYRLEDAD